jgi:hypothetical protein
MKTRIITASLCVALASCASQETPRDVDTVSSDKIKTLFPPKVTKADEKGLSIRFAEVSMGFDATCNPFRSFSDERNDCNELPESVKTLAIDHCEKHGKKAVFMGNKTNIVQMTVSKFTCQDKN